MATKRKLLSSIFILAVICAAVWGGYVYVANDDHGKSAQVVESEIRQDLPVGTSLEETEEYLTKNTYEFSYSEKNKVVYLIETDITGGDIFVKPALTMKIYFDEGLKISSIESRVLFTGP